MFVVLQDGGHDFPAAREKRMHIMPNDYVFFIVNVKAADQGVYSCTATSEAGQAVANATLNVLGEVHVTSSDVTVNVVQHSVGRVS